MKDMKKDKKRRVDVLREVEAMHRRAAAVDATSLTGDMRWYGAARRRVRLVRRGLSAVACVAVFVATMALLPEEGYYYMEGADDDHPQAVCADIRTILNM